MEQIDSCWRGGGVEDWVKKDDEIKGKKLTGTENRMVITRGEGVRGDRRG